MAKFNTDKGIVTVDYQSENFYLCTVPSYNGQGKWEIYVVALDPEEAVQRAIRFYYGKDPKRINRE